MINHLTELRELAQDAIKPNTEIQPLKKQLNNNLMILRLHNNQIQQLLQKCEDL